MQLGVQPRFSSLQLDIQYSVEKQNTSGKLIELKMKSPLPFSFAFAPTFVLQAREKLNGGKRVEDYIESAPMQRKQDTLVSASL